MPAVLEMVGREIGEPLAGEFRILHEEQNLGLPLRDAMLNLVERVPRDDMRFLATAILLQKETGGNLALILDKTAALARERARLIRAAAYLHRPGTHHRLDSLYRAFHHVWPAEPVNWKYERILFTNPTGLKIDLCRTGDDAVGCSDHSQDYRYQGLNQVGTMSLIIFSEFAPSWASS